MMRFNIAKFFSEAFQNTNYHLIQISCDSCELELLFVFLYSIVFNQSFHLLICHTYNFLYRYMKNASLSGLVKVSAVCSLLSIQHILIILFSMKLRKWWYLKEICFVIGHNLLYSATEIHILLSSDTLQKTPFFGRCILKIKYNFFINAIKFITSLNAYINVIYSASVVLKTIYVCNLLHHNNGNPEYVINYPVCDMTFYEWSESAWPHPPAKPEYT